jgi:MtN3 and saliva related transmembrane protein
MSSQSNDEAIVGITISILAIIYNIPLVYRVLKRGSARDIDLWFLLIRSVAVTITIAYGIMIDDIFIVISNVVPLVSSLTILLVKAVNHGKSGTWIDVKDYTVKYMTKYTLDHNSPGWSSFTEILNLNTESSL